MYTARWTALNFKVVRKVCGVLGNSRRSWRKTCKKNESRALLNETFGLSEYVASINSFLERTKKESVCLSVYFLVGCFEAFASSEKVYGAMRCLHLHVRKTNRGAIWRSLLSSMKDCSGKKKNVNSEMEKFRCEINAQVRN